ncbi:MAG: hypothetical protein H8D87_06465 [Deltaproteobacteria bacterium]|nr:hypothetical protein [Candidatus Desulfobacula maris]
MKWLQKIKCSIPFNLFWIGHELRIIQDIKPTGSQIVQCVHCGRLFGMNHDVKAILPLSKEMAEMYFRSGNKLEHIQSKHCWCEPILEYEDSENGNQVWVHNEIN